MNYYDDFFGFLEKDYFKKGDKRKLEKSLSSDSFLLFKLGAACRKCCHQETYEITTRKAPLFQCFSCKHQTSLTSGTVMEKNRKPLRKWLWAISPV